MYNVFDKDILTENGYAQFFGDDNKPMVNTLQGPADENVKKASETCCEDGLPIK